MNEIKIGNVVKFTYQKVNPEFYAVEQIEEKNCEKIALLKGITHRIETIGNVQELEVADLEKINKTLKSFETRINTRAEQLLEKYKELNNIIDSKTREERSKNSEKILHLDGDKEYANKSSRIYSKLGLNAVVKNIKENMQPLEIKNLLDKYRPEILIITGHDGMINKRRYFNDIMNYRNSRFFVKTVEEARKWEKGYNKLAIFAGACQSYYEAIMEAGANFASSPARILIDFMDPLIIAQKVAITPNEKYITMKDIRNLLKNGERGISGIGTYGKLF